jgi:AcrR family transcriptional regulator
VTDPVDALGSDDYALPDLGLAREAPDSWPARSPAGLLFEDPLLSLSPTGRTILAAAHQVLKRDGFAGLSVGAVAKAAGENKSTILYHFGDKAGLVTALTNSLLSDMQVKLLPLIERKSRGGNRIRILMDVHRSIARDSEYWRTLYDLLPHITRDRRLHARFKTLMDWYYEVILRTLGLLDENGDNTEANLVASLMLSVLEGFALQRLLMGPRGFDLDARFRLWESLVTPLIERLAQESSGDSDGPTERP